jgi:hypothetical protein
MSLGAFVNNRWLSILLIDLVGLLLRAFFLLLSWH